MGVETLAEYGLSGFARGVRSNDPEEWRRIDNTALTEGEPYAQFVPLGVWSGWSVSSFGRVRDRAGAILPVCSYHGEQCVRLLHGRYRVARLVALAFVDPSNRGVACNCVRWRNGDRTDNRAVNLFWAERSA